MSRIHIGRRATLPVLRAAPQGLYLGWEDEQVLLPRRFAPEDAGPGSSLRVFVYTDSEDRPVATTQSPKACAGEFAWLRVVDVGAHGAFLDWGLDKDLLAPFGEQVTRLRVGDERVFAVTLDPRTERVIAASKLARHFDYDVEDVLVDDEVSLLVYGRNEVGYLVIVDGRHTGIVYNNEVYRPIAPGDSLRGFVKAVRDDNKLDIRLQRRGKDAIDDVQKLLLDALEREGGYLPLHDKSSPEEIRETLGVSKKAFKRALGGLYKARRVTLEDAGIRLHNESP